MTRQYKRSNLSFALLALVILLCVSWLWQADMREQQVDYSQMRQLFLQEKVEAFTIDSGGMLTMQLRQAVDGSEIVRYQLYDFQLFYDDFNDLVQEQYAKGVITAYDYPDPESTNYYYYALGDDNTHHFFRTYSEMQSFMASQERYSNS